MRRFNVWLLLPVGVAAGVLLMTVLHHRARPDGRTQLPEDDRVARSERRTAGPSDLDRWRLQNIEAKVAALEASPTPPSDPPARTSPQHRPTARDRAAKMEEEFRIHQELISKSLSSPRVEPWASEMEKKLDAGFKAASADIPGGKYQGSSCRSDSCVVKVSWPSIEVAQGGMMALMAITSPTGCARQVALPPPERVGNGALESDVVLDCKKKAEPPL